MKPITKPLQEPPNPALVAAALKWQEEEKKREGKEQALRARAIKELEEAGFSSPKEAHVRQRMWDIRNAQLNAREERRRKRLRLRYCRATLEEVLQAKEKEKK